MRLPLLGVGESAVRQSRQASAITVGVQAATTRQDQIFVRSLPSYRRLRKMKCECCRMENGAHKMSCSYREGRGERFSMKNISLEEAREAMGGEYLKNAEEPEISVRHADLTRFGESAYKSKCPCCKEGILLVGRDQKTLDLLEYDRCVVCAQLIRYSDIEELREKEG